MRRVVAPVMGFLALSGMADSAFLVLRHMGLLKGEPSLVASLCEIAKGSCESAARSNAGSIFGIPAPVLGGLYFAAIVVIVIARIHLSRWLFPYATLAFLAVGLGYSGYLAYTLIAVLGKPCPYCLAAHTINVGIFVLYVVSLHADLASPGDSP